jgi:glutamine synthetase
LSETLNQIKETGLAVDVTLEAGLLKDVTAASAQLRQALSKLEKAAEKAAAEKNTRKKAELYCHQVTDAMEALRGAADRLEMLLGKEYWPMPTYTELLYGNL